MERDQSRQQRARSFAHRVSNDGIAWDLTLNEYVLVGEPGLSVDHLRRQQQYRPWQRQTHFLANFRSVNLQG